MKGGGPLEGGGDDLRPLILFGNELILELYAKDWIPIAKLSEIFKNCRLGPK